MSIQWIISVVVGGLGAVFIFRQMKWSNTHAEKLEQQELELQRKDEEIRVTKQQLMAQDQLATMGRLIAGIAHEIKNPLNFVTNFSELSIELSEELQAGLEKYRQRLGEVAFRELQELVEDIRQNAIDTNKNGQRASNIVRSMMDHTRGTQSGLKPIALNALLDENIKLAYHGYKAMDPQFTVRIERIYAPYLPEVEAYVAELGRVLLNILNNACDAVQERRKQLGERFEPQISLRTVCEGEMVKIEIWDNGIGIAPDVLENIFKPFFTTKPVSSGNTGLGLAISREIIEEQHGGQLLVESKWNEYTCFTILLPIVSHTP
ncbi:MAG: ATP-binding protein [Bacteroidota bacterium]